MTTIGKTVTVIIILFVLVTFYLVLIKTVPKVDYQVQPTDVSGQEPTFNEPRPSVDNSPWKE